MKSRLDLASGSIWNPVVLTLLIAVTGLVVSLVFNVLQCSHNRRSERAEADRFRQQLTSWLVPSKSLEANLIVPDWPDSVETHSLPILGGYYDVIKANILTNVCVFLVNRSKVDLTLVGYAYSEIPQETLGLWSRLDEFLKENELGASYSESLGKTIRPGDSTSLCMPLSMHRADTSGISLIHLFVVAETPYRTHSVTYIWVKAMNSFATPSGLKLDLTNELLVNEENEIVARKYSGHGESWVTSHNYVPIVLDQAGEEKLQRFERSYDNNNELKLLNEILERVTKAEQKK